VEDISSIGLSRIQLILSLTHSN